MAMRGCRAGEARGIRPREGNQPGRTWLQSESVSLIRGCELGFLWRPCTRPLRPWELGPCTDEGDRSGPRSGARAFFRRFTSRSLPVSETTARSPRMAIVVGVERRSSPSPGESAVPNEPTRPPAAMSRQTTQLRAAAATQSRPKWW